MNKHPVARWSRVIPQVRDRGDRSIRVRKPSHDHHGPHGDKRQNRYDLNHGEPELDLTEVLHRGQIQRQQRSDHDKRGNKRGQLREPVMRVIRNRQHIRNTRGHPEEPVRPADEKARASTQNIRYEIGK